MEITIVTYVAGQALIFILPRHEDINMTTFLIKMNERRAALKIANDGIKGIKTFRANPIIINNSKNTQLIKDLLIEVYQQSYQVDNIHFTAIDKQNLQDQRWQEDHNSIYEVVMAFESKYNQPQRTIEYTFKGRYLFFCVPDFPGSKASVVYDILKYKLARVWQNKIHFFKCSDQDYSYIRMTCEDDSARGQVLSKLKRLLEEEYRRRSTRISVNIVANNDVVIKNRYCLPKKYTRKCTKITLYKINTRRGLLVLIEVVSNSSRELGHNFTFLNQNLSSFPTDVFAASLKTGYVFVKKYFDGENSEFTRLCSLIEKSGYYSESKASLRFLFKMISESSRSQFFERIEQFFIYDRFMIAVCKNTDSAIYQKVFSKNVFLSYPAFCAVIESDEQKYEREEYAYDSKLHTFMKIPYVDYLKAYLGKGYDSGHRESQVMSQPPGQLYRKKNTRKRYHRDDNRVTRSRNTIPRELSVDDIISRSELNKKRPKPSRVSRGALSVLTDDVSILLKDLQIDLYNALEVSYDVQAVVLRCFCSQKNTKPLMTVKVDKKPYYDKLKLQYKDCVFNSLEMAKLYYQYLCYFKVMAAVGETYRAPGKKILIKVYDPQYYNRLDRVTFMSYSCVKYDGAKRKILAQVYRDDGKSTTLDITDVVEHCTSDGLSREILSLAHDPKKIDLSLSAQRFIRRACGACVNVVTAQTRSQLKITISHPLYPATVYTKTLNAEDFLSPSVSQKQLSPNRFASFNQRTKHKPCSISWQTTLNSQG